MKRTLAIVGTHPLAGVWAALAASAGAEVRLIDDHDDVSPEEACHYLQACLARCREAGDFLNPAASARVRLVPLAQADSQLADVDWMFDASARLSIWKEAHIPAWLAALPEHAGLGLCIGTAPLAAMGRRAPGLSHERLFYTRFFAPIRRTRLVEITHLGAPSDRQERLLALLSEVFGKDTLLVRDAPGGLAVRLHIYAFLRGLQHARAAGFGMEEADAWAGRVAGRRSRSLFGGADWFGLDVLADCARDLYAALEDDPFRPRFEPSPLEDLIARAESVTAPGEAPSFYRPRSTLRDPRPAGQHVLDLHTAYGAWVPLRGVPAARTLRLEYPDPVRRLKSVLARGGPEGEFVWRLWRDLMAYAAWLAEHLEVPVGTIDRAVRWGLGWSLGPFEVWDALGIEAVVERMQADGVPVPALAERLRRLPLPAWYTLSLGRKSHFVPVSDRYEDVPTCPADLSLTLLRQARGERRRDGSLALVDLEAGIHALVSNHPQGFAVDEAFVAFANRLFDDADSLGLRALVLYSEGLDFSLGLSLEEWRPLLREARFDALERKAAARQALFQRFKQAPFPVLAVLHGRALGVGWELAMHAAARQIHIEAEIGFDVPALGLLPTAGGCKELLYRSAEHEEQDGPSVAARAAFLAIHGHPQPYGAYEARHIGLLRRGDRLTIGRAHLLHEARDHARSLVENGFTRLPSPPLRLGGAGSVAALSLFLQSEPLADTRAPHEAWLDRRLAEILCGGDTGPHRRVGEAELLALERRAFAALIREEETRRRAERAERPAD